jgi:hypothetical protein
VRQLYVVCEGVLQCYVRFDVENLKVAIIQTEAACGNEPASSAKWKRERRKRPQGTKHDIFAI